MLYNPLTYFRTPQGQEIRNTFFAQEKNKKCYICGIRTHLVPHHLTYNHLGQELKYKDLIALCSKDRFRRRSCHFRVHFKLSGEKVPIEKKIMLKRIRMLKLTNGIRNFRLGSLINAIWYYIS